MICNENFDFRFDESACEKCGGKCCTGDSGYIWASKDEISKMAEHFGFSFDEFCKIFTQKVGVKFSLKEKPFEDGFACIFFDEKARNCGIYELRPMQCRTFPFWEHFKENFEELERECIGVC